MKVTFKIYSRKEGRIPIEYISDASIDAWFRRNIILFFSIFTFTYALFMPDASTIIGDYVNLLTHQTYLMHDFFEIGGIAATFLNVSLHFLVAFYLMRDRESFRFNGLQMGAIGIFIGHSFFGTHPLNFLPIIFGIWLYTKYTEQKFSRNASICLFAASNGPIISFILFREGLSLQSLFLALVFGIAVGFIAVPLAEHVIKFHQGFTLYNFGFTAGIIAMFTIVFFNMLDFEIQSVSYISDHAHVYALIFIILILVFLLILAFIGKKSTPNYREEYTRLIDSSGRVPADFVTRFGYGVSAMNMFFNGIIFLSIVLLTGYPINGSVIGGIISVIGFSAFGKHPRNSIPIAFGVTLATLISGDSFQSQTYLLPLLFGTSLAPIGGYFGFGYGVLAGFLHYHLVNNVFVLHLGMNLYNNGFSSGFVAAFLVPLLEILPDSWVRK